MGRKNIPHKLNDEAYSLAYNFLARDQGCYNPSTTVINPPSSEILILFDNSTLTSKILNLFSGTTHFQSSKNNDM